MAMNGRRQTPRMRQAILRSADKRIRANSCTAAGQAGAQDARLASHACAWSHLDWRAPASSRARPQPADTPAMHDTLQAPRSQPENASAAYPDTELLSPATQLVSDKEAYLGGAAGDIGRRVGDDQLELFVVCQPAEAMRQQLQQLAPEYIALHDLGSSSSARLLAAVAAAAQCKLQQLVIRRQGYGVALATLQFVELPLSPQRKLRVYTTQIDADTQTRQQLAQLLLAHSRLGVVLIGELPAHALASSLQPLREAISAGPWPNRQLLLVPLAPAATLAAQAATLAGGSGVMVRTTPQAGRAEQAWSYVTGTWRLVGATAPRPGNAAEHSARSAAAARPFAAEPLAAIPMPGIARPSAQPDVRSGQAAMMQKAWQEHVQRCAAIDGVSECGVFDVDSQRLLAHCGTLRHAQRMASKGALLHAVVGDCAQALDASAAGADVAITLARHILLLCPVPDQPRLAQYLLVDRAPGRDIATVRAQLQQLGAPGR
jgi:hypothetical protein